MEAFDKMKALLTAGDALWGKEEFLDAYMKYEKITKIATADNMPIERILSNSKTKDVVISAYVMMINMNQFNIEQHINVEINKVQLAENLLLAEKFGYVSPEKSKPAKKKIG